MIPETLESLAAVLHDSPGDADAHFRAAQIHLREQGWARAAAHLRVVAAARPDAAIAWAQLAFALASLRRGVEARRAVERALAIDDRLADAWNVLGILEQESGEPAKARSCFERALALSPRLARARLNLANCDRAAGRAAEALAGYREALALDPSDAHAHYALGLFQQTVAGDARSAARHYRDALAIQPGLDLARHHLSHALLVLGEFDEAWGEHAARPPRRHHEISLRRSGRAYAIPSPAEIAGKRIAILAEQGLGDTLFFLRFAPLLRARGAILHFVGDERLHAMLLRTGIFDGVSIEAPPEATITLLAGDLPLVAGAATAPSLVLSPLPERAQALRDRWAAIGPAPHVGLAWRAGEGFRGADETLSKEIPLEALGAALRGVEATWISLQREPRPGENEALASAMGAPVHDLSAVNRDLEDALAMAESLDELVCVSNTNVHLREGTGRASRVLVPFPPEWRWMAEGNSPWFPGTETYRQGADRSWDAALGLLHADLASAQTQS